MAKHKTRQTYISSMVAYMVACLPLPLVGGSVLYLWLQGIIFDIGLAVYLGLAAATTMVIGILMVWWVNKPRLRTRSRRTDQPGLDAGCSPRLDISMTATDEINRMVECLDDSFAQSESGRGPIIRPVYEEESTKSDEETLVDCQAMFNVFMEHLPALAFIKDKKGRYIYINSAFQELLNLASGDVIGYRDSDLWPAEIADQLCRNDQQIISNNQVCRSIERVAVGRVERYHLTTRFAIAHEGRTRMLGGIAFDITDKVRAEEENASLEQQLIHAQKIEAIGTLAGGIAHDFNNVLAAIMGYVELAQFDAERGKDVRCQLTQVLSATHRAKELVSQILTFSRKTEQVRKPIDPEPLVEEVLKLIRASLPATIEIRERLESRGVKVLANATQLHQVIMNLCTNAAHAMEQKGGILEVCLKSVHLAGMDAARQGVPPASYLELSVRDTGHGITPALQERIFDPYFTTKAQGKGTGMGLAVVHGIVKSHGGIIKVESQPGKGTRFRIMLPVTARVTEMRGEKVETLPKGRESVLFVDDEPFLVDLGQQMLTRLGYRVTSCSSSTDALKMVRRDPHRFDAVVTDFTMPHMTGDKLADQILAIRPDLPVIMCTGYSELITKEESAQIGIAALLMKPLTIGDLARNLRRVLDHGSPYGVLHCLKTGSAD